MAGLIIDTNSWIELAKPRWNALLAELEGQASDKRIEILMNTIVLEEWERNKERITGTIIESIKSHAKSALKIQEFISKEEGDALRSILEKYRDEESLQLEIAESHIDRVEELMWGSFVIEISDELKCQITQRALEKRAPFHNGKNNVADALIIFSAIDYIDSNKKIQKDLIFVSSNYKEFSNPDNIEEIHPEIESDSKSANLIFSNNIARVLKIKEEAVDDIITYAEFQFWDWIEHESEIARGK